MPTRGGCETSRFERADQKFSTLCLVQQRLDPRAGVDDRMVMRRTSRRTHTTATTAVVRLLSGVLGAATVVLMILGGGGPAARDGVATPADAAVGRPGPTSTSTSTSTSTTTTSTSSTTVPAPTTVMAAEVSAPPPPPPAVTTSCADAIAYLQQHQAPGFVDVCGPGSALGRYGYTCWNVPGRCPDGAKVIHIACPAPFVYMNEAHNSWALQGQRSGIDPYGQGSPAEQAACDRLR
jgi:hypothetical protein